MLYSSSFRFGFLLFFLLAFITIVSAVDIDNCRGINADVLGVSNTLTTDINGWVGTCFPLIEDAGGTYFELDCNNHFIDANSNSNILFDTDAFNINQIIFRNCDINLRGINAISGFGIRVDSDANFIVISDSNVDMNDGAFFYSDGAVDISIDLNFLGGNFITSGDSEGFWFNGSNYGSFVVRNLVLQGSGVNLFNLSGNLGGVSILNSDINYSGDTLMWIEVVSSGPFDLNFSGTNVYFTDIGLYFASNNYPNVIISNANFLSGGGTFFYDFDVDINNITLLDSNLDFDVSSTFFRFFTNTFENYLSFDFNNVDANYLYFLEDTRLDLNAFGADDSYIRINSGSDINFITINSAGFSQTAGNYILLNGVSDLDLTIDFLDSNFTITNSNLLSMQSSDINTIKVSDINVVSRGSSGNLFVLDSSDLKYFYFSDSTIDINDGYIVNLTEIDDSFLEFDFRTNIWRVSDNASGFFLQDVNLGKFGVSGFDVHSTGSYFFYISTSDLGQFNLFDSAITGEGTGALVRFYNVSSSLDLNFFSSDINLQNNPAFFFGSSYIDNFSVADLNLFDFGGSGSVFYTNSSDLNSINILNSNLTTKNTAFFHNATNDLDNYLSLEFNNTDVNSLVFTDLNLNLTAMGPGNYFISITDNSDLNYIAFTGTNTIDLNSTNFLSVNSTVDSYINFDFTNATVSVEDSWRFFSFSDSNISTFETSDLNVPSSLNYDFYYISNSDLNTINLFDSDIPTSGSAYFVNLTSTNDSSIDFNFSGTTLDINVDAGGAGFYFSSSNYNSFSISDLTNLAHVDSGSAFLKVLGSSDVNTFTFLNSTFDISSNSTFYDAAVQDSFLSFDFNKTDANYLLFNDLNVNLTAIGNNLLKIDAGSDLNYVSFSGNTQIDMNNGNMLLLTGNTNYDSLDFNFGDFPITLTGNAAGFRFSDGNYNSISINNLNLNSSSGVAVIKNDSNIASLSLLYSDIVVTAGRFFDRSTVCIGPCSPLIISTVDLNFFGSDLNVSGAGILPFFLSNTVYSGNFNVSNLKSTASDDYLFTMSDVNITNLNVTDSNFYLDQFAVLGGTYVLGGTIYNNEFIDTNILNNFIYLITGSFGADFNTTLNENNYSKRVLWFDDDSNATGGNLWLNANGTNLCTTDSVSPFGICDSVYNILGSGVNYSDALPLREYNLLDLNVSNIDFNAESIIYGESVDINATIYNNSDDATDRNFFVEYYIGGVLDANYELDAVLASGASLVDNHTWNSNIAGDVNVYVCVNYPLDTNTLNDCNQQTLTVTAPPSGGKPAFDLKVSIGTSGSISEKGNTTITVQVSKTGNAKVSGASMNLLLVLPNGGKKELFSKALADNDFPYTYKEEFGISDLLKINPDVFPLVDVKEGKATFLVEVDASEDKDTTNNKANASAKVIYFDAKISNVTLKSKEKTQQIKKELIVDFEILKKYTLGFDIDYIAINLQKNTGATIKNKTNEKTIIAYHPQWLGKHGGVATGSVNYSKDIKLLDLMSVDKASNVIVDVMDWNIKDQKVQDVLATILGYLAKLSGDDFEYPEDVALFKAVPTEEIVLDITANNSKEDSFSFELNYIKGDLANEDNVHSSDTNQSGQSDGTQTGPGGGGAGGDVNNWNILFGDTALILKYKEKIGLGETQEIFVFDDNKNPVSYLPISITDENKNLVVFETDNNGFIAYVPEFAGKYTISAPHPNPKVTGKFEVIEGYVSSDSDFVEIASSWWGGETGKATKTGLLIAGIIIGALVLILLLYRALRPKKKYGLEEMRV